MGRCDHWNTRYPGKDACVYVRGEFMGMHYVNASILEQPVNPEKPEEIKRMRLRDHYRFDSPFLQFDLEPTVA
jgi:hypothetical protein